MEAKKIVGGVVKLWVLAILAGAIWFLWAERVKPPLENEVEESQEIKHTDVEVRIGQIKQMALREYVTGYGSVEPEPATAEAPAAEARLTMDWPPGYVDDVKCVEGEHVEKGQILMASVGRRNIISPISGTVTVLNVHAGEVAQPSEVAVDVVDLDRLVMAVGLPAWEAAGIEPGKSATVEIPADPAGGASVKFTGDVERVDRVADPKTNLVSVDIAIPAGSHVRPGQFGRANIVRHEEANCLVVPADAVVRDSFDRPYIAIVSDDQKQAILQLIEPGMREGDWVQVMGEGLSVGQTIVTGGAYGLLFRSDIQVINQ
jgi:hypothetical protein